MRCVAIVAWLFAIVALTVKRDLPLHCQNQGKQDVSISYYIVAPIVGGCIWFV